MSQIIRRFESTSVSRFMTLAPSILIVEDDPKTAELIDRFLTKEGFRTTRAADGYAAIDAFAAVGPDLVILDVMLPKF